MKVVIIEDEKITARDLKRTILGIEPDIEVSALLHSIEDATDFFKNNKAVDLIFADIQLGDGLSFEIFNQLDCSIPIIFCTAHNTYFAEAFRATGIDYVLKPFTKAAIEKALSKYQELKKTFAGKNENYQQLFGLLETKITAKRTAVIVRQRDKIIPLPAIGIAVFYVENGATFAFTFKEEKFILQENMEDLELSFSPGFFRANRQYLVNRHAIKDAAHFFNRKVIINLTVPFKGQILVGKLKTSMFIEWLAQH